MLIECLALFSVAFLSATLLPMGSEAYLSYLLIEYPSVLMLWLIVATTGNSLGGATNWWLGNWSHRFEGRRFYPSNDKLARAQRFYQRFGALTLVMSWLPVLGDAFCVCAGICRYPFWRFLLFVFLGKFLRYAVVALGVMSITN